MDEAQLNQILAGLTAQLEREGAKLEGLRLDDLRDALSHPAAAAEVLKTLELEKHAVREGDPAPDLRLRRLPGPHGEGEVQLSEEIREHPVALVFGSYT